MDERISKRMRRKIKNLLEEANEEYDRIKIVDYGEGEKFISCIFCLENECGFEKGEYVEDKISKESKITLSNCSGCERKMK